jgi:DNA polymerase-3 subunit beta
MQLIVGRDSLSRGLARIQGVLNRKATLPVLSNALIEARRTAACGSPPRTSTSPSTAACPRASSAPAASRSTASASTRSPATCPGEEVSITVDDDQRVLCAAELRSSCSTAFPPTGTPRCPRLEGIKLLPVDGAALRELIERTQFSVSTDESRPNLNGVYFQCLGDGRIRMVSTDGHRLSQGERDARADAATSPSATASSSPARASRRSSAARRGAADRRSTSASWRTTWSSPRGGHLFVRLIDAAFPDYTLVIPSRRAQGRARPRPVPGNALKRISMLASERTHGDAHRTARSKHDPAQRQPRSRARPAKRSRSRATTAPSSPSRSTPST